MAVREVMQVYLCPRCLLAGEDPGACQRCGGERLACLPGNLGDPVRRPLIDVQGRVQTRAPQWWLHHSVRRLEELRERAQTPRV